MYNLIKSIYQSEKLPKHLKWILVALVLEYSNSNDSVITSKPFYFNNIEFRNKYNLREKVFRNGLYDLEKRMILNYHFLTNDVCMVTFLF